jgi:hypothetical protein
VHRCIRLGVDQAECALETNKFWVSVASKEDKRPERLQLLSEKAIPICQWTYQKSQWIAARARGRPSPLHWIILIFPNIFAGVEKRVTLDLHFFDQRRSKHAGFVINFSGLRLSRKARIDDQRNDNANKTQCAND